jgi:GDP-L-fucose synthase
MEKDARIYVAGHRGLVGSAIVRGLLAAGHTNLVYRTHKELSLIDQAAVRGFFESERPEFVFMAAARVGGIHANNFYRGEFIYENLAMATNVIDSAHRSDVKRMVFLGSSCIYPRDCPQPMREEHLLTGPLEQTNEPYAIAKIAGLKMCEAYNSQYGAEFVAVMPTNLYGINDNFDLETSHVLPALIRKSHEATLRGDDTLEVWGTGRPLREFLFVDDLAEACIFVMNQHGTTDMLNIGSGEEVSIRELAETVCDVVGFTGKIEFDPGRPDGTPRKLLDSSRINRLGWHPKVELREGIRITYRWFRETYGNQ